MIFLDDYLNHWRVNYGHVVVPADELTSDMLRGAQITVDKANQLLAAFGEHCSITSGWRPIEVNRLIPGAAKHSTHMACHAVDLSDADGGLDGWIDEHPEILDKLDLWRESPARTSSWCHIQITPYGSWVSGRSRTFLP